jgi:hypothetical protein
VLSQMLAKGLKSRAQVEVMFPKLVVLFAPNTAGESKPLDAIQPISRIGTARTLSDALSGPIRGYPVDALRSSKGGLPHFSAKNTSPVFADR